jgi:transposase
MQAESLQLFLCQMREQFPDERMGIVWDNAPSHRSHQIAWPAEMVPMALPAYSPELNPAEQIFRVLRRRLANRIFETLDELQEALVAELEQFWAAPEVLIRLTGYPWWIESLPSS